MSEKNFRIRHLDDMQKDLSVDYFETMNEASAQLQNASSVPGHVTIQVEAWDGSKWVVTGGFGAYPQ